MKSTTVAQLALSTVGSWLAWIGVFTSSLSAVSALVRIFDFGISKFYTDVIETYRALIQPLYSLVGVFIPHFQELWVDLFVLYLTLFTMSIRAAVLPLFNAEYLDNEQTLVIDSELVSKPEKTFDEDILDSEAWQNDQPEAPYDFGSEGKIQYLLPSKSIWTKWILLSIALWPVITLLPARRILFPSILFVEPTPNSWGTEVKLKSERITFANWFIRTQRLNFFNLIQMITLPLAVILFLLLATYNPLP